MNYIQPIKRPINKNENIYWQENHKSNRIRYESFIEKMTQRGLSSEEINKLWKSNFGYIPDPEPLRLYYCNIISSNLKMVTTVVRRDDFKKGERKYEVVKLNSLFIDNYNNTRNIKIQDGKILVDVENENISIKAQIEKAEQIGEERYALNHVDGKWFTNLTIDNIVNKLNIKIKPEENAVFNDFNSIESYNFDIEDNDFKEKLYNLINEKFIEIESQLE